MRRYSQRQGFATVSEINVTPLLDLAFVLLIIFIITTPLMDRSANLIIPSSKAADNAVDPAQVQMVEIDRNLALRLNRRDTALAELETELAAMKAADPGVAVVIRAHKELPVQKLVEVMDAIQRAGIGKVGVLTTRER